MTEIKTVTTVTNLTKDSSVKNVTRTIPRINQMEAEIRRILIS